MSHTTVCATNHAHNTRHTACGDDACHNVYASNGRQPNTTSPMALSRPGKHMIRQLTGWLATVCILAALATPTPTAAQVPTPEEIIGFEPGADYHLLSYAHIQDYFHALAAASDRVQLEEIGKSTEGRPMLLAVISSQENLQRKERLRRISEKLARANSLTEYEARELAREGVAVVWIDAGLHSTEIAPTQHTPVLAHWLVTDEGEEARRIRENVILLLMPVMNPDGLDLVVDWYNRTRGTRFEGTSPPQLYHHYVGHNNNRDWYMFTQQESRVIARQLYHEWYPQIVYNPHQSAPSPARIWVPPQAEPVNPNRDAMVFISRNRIGYHMKQRFEREGKAGAVSGIVFDNWYSGYMSSAPDFHNMIAILTETASSVYASPRCIEPEDLPATFGRRGNYLSAREPSNKYPSPWPGGCWTLGDQVEYSMTASQAILEIASKLKEEYLYDIYLMGRRQIARGENAEGGSFAYIVDPAAQHDAGAAMELLRTFRRSGIEIRRAAEPFVADGKRYGAGSFVMGPQAFRPYVVDLLDPTPYPEQQLYPGGPQQRPYDMTGYQLSLKMNLDIGRAREPFPLPETLVQETDIPAPAGNVVGNGAYGFLLDGTWNVAAIAVNRLQAKGATVAWTGEDFTDGQRHWPAGSFVVQGAERSALEALAVELGLDFVGAEQRPTPTLLELRKPRIGIYRGHLPNMPEGWVRWLLDQYDFQYRSISDAEMRAGQLQDYDVIILPEQQANRMLRGYGARNMPEEYTGGMGEEGAAALKTFVERGGWVVALDQATVFAKNQFSLPVASPDIPNDSLAIPGSLLRIESEVTHPLAFGMAPEANAVFARSTLLEPAPSSDSENPEAAVDVYVQYASEDLLASGWELGADRYVAGQPAAMRVGLGEGQVVLVGFSPLYRGQAHGTFKLLFNPLYAATLDRHVWMSAVARAAGEGSALKR